MLSWYNCRKASDTTFIQFQTCHLLFPRPLCRGVWRADGAVPLARLVRHIRRSLHLRVLPGLPCAAPIGCRRESHRECPQCANGGVLKIISQLRNPCNFLSHLTARHIQSFATEDGGGGVFGPRILLANQLDWALFFRREAK